MSFNADHVAARAVDLIGQAQGDRLAGDGGLKVVVQGDDTAHCARLAGGQYAHIIADSYAPGGDQAAEASEVEIGPVDPLDGHPKRLVLIRCHVELDALQVFDQGTALVPGRIRRQGGDVVALKAGDRHSGEGFDADAPGKGAIVGGDSVKARLIVPDQVHLVDGQNEIAHA